MVESDLPFAFCTHEDLKLVSPAKAGTIRSDQIEDTPTTAQPWI